MRLGKRGKRAAVLGCGPAGLFAAHGLVEMGWDVTILSNKRRSEMFGAQYLHEPVHGLAEVGTVLKYELLGTPEGYRRKVYGDAPVDSVSPELYKGYQQVWDIRAAYYDAWSQYHERIIHLPEINGTDLRSLLETNAYRLILSSIPAPALCKLGHQFQSARVWAIGDAPERGIFSPVDLRADKVICNGEKSPGWYRASHVFGYNTTEWPGGSKPPISDVASVVKPTSTNCDCWVDSGVFHRIGRYGTWTKGVLSHEAYLKAKELTR